MLLVVKTLAVRPAMFLSLALFAIGCGGDDDDGVPQPDSGSQQPTIDAMPTADSAPAADSAPTADAQPSTVTVVDCGDVDPVETITIDGLAFDPPTVTISAGDSVMWMNEDGVPHTVTSGNPGAQTSDFDSGSVSDGDDVCLTFASAGSFEYFCKIHTSMNNGLVTVN